MMRIMSAEFPDGLRYLPCFNEADHDEKRFGRNGLICAEPDEHRLFQSSDSFSLKRISRIISFNRFSILFIRVVK